MTVRHNYESVGLFVTLLLQFSAYQSPWIIPQLLPNQKISELHWQVNERPQVQSWTYVCCLYELAVRRSA